MLISSSRSLSDLILAYSFGLRGQKASPKCSPGRAPQDLLGQRIPFILELLA